VGSLAQGDEQRAPRPANCFRHALRYRQWIRREVWPKMPARPLWRFLYMYLARFGFLDGRAGWHLAWLMASYEYMISLMYHDKLLSTQARGGGQDHDPRGRAGAD
jgi:hypothetical protein